MNHQISQISKFKRKYGNYLEEVIAAKQIFYAAMSGYGNLTDDYGRWAIQVLGHNFPKDVKYLDALWASSFRMPTSPRY